MKRIVGTVKSWMYAADGGAVLLEVVVPAPEVDAAQPILTQLKEAGEVLIVMEVVQ